MKLPRELTTVTRLSKFLALVMFITLPVIAFAFGMNYKDYVENNKIFLASANVVPASNGDYPCELDVNVCPDNSLVGRYPPSCDFARCENRDVEGLTSYTCPSTEWVDCMPGPDKPQKVECTPEYLQWAQTSCPGFQGAAL